MGRIGSGEMTTIAFGLMGPLLYLAVGVLLVLWGRQQARAGKGTAAQVGWISPIVGIASALLGIAGTAALLAGAFDGATAAPVESRAEHVADGISGAMDAFAIGLGLSLLLYVVSFVANVVATARSRAPQTTTPPP